MAEVVPPEPGDWTLAARAVPDGVRIEFSLPALVATEVVAALTLTREQARAFARGVLAAAGDAAERTFPKPAEATDG